MPYNSAADSFHINFAADFLQAKCDFRGKIGRFAFLSHLAPRRGLPVSVNLTFFARSYG